MIDQVLLTKIKNRTDDDSGYNNGDSKQDDLGEDNDEKELLPDDSEHEDIEELEEETE